jgi:hypothetical protein
VADEEAAGIIDQKLIEVGRDRFAHAEAEGHVGDEFGQSLLPVTPAIRTLPESICQVLRTPRSITVSSPRP